MQIFMYFTVWGSKIEPFYKNMRAEFRFPILYINVRSGVRTKYNDVGWGGVQSRNYLLFDADPKVSFMTYRDLFNIIQKN